MHLSSPHRDMLPVVKSQAEMETFYIFFQSWLSWSLGAEPAAPDDITTGGIWGFREVMSDS